MLYPEKKHSDIERWICVYPAYINGKKTVAEGRRLPKKQCCDNPTFQEMKDVLSSAGLKVEVENKMYCREQNREVAFRGRVRVQLKNDDETPVLADFPSRKSVLLYLGTMIPKLKNRQQKNPGNDQTQSQQAGSKKGKPKGRR